MTPKEALKAAETALKNGDLMQAMELYNRILSKVPRHPGARKGVRKVEKMALAGTRPVTQDEFDNALQVMQSGNPAKAERIVVGLLQRSPMMPGLHNLLGMCRSSQGQNAQAIEAFSRALELEPGQPEVANNLGLALLETGELEKAAELLQGILKKNPDQAPVHFNLGTVFERQGKFEHAETSLNHALRLAPEMYEPWLELGKLLALQGYNERAIPCLLKAIELNPEDAQAYLILGRLKNLSPDDSIVQKIQLLADDKTVADLDRASLQFALGAIHERSENCDQAFCHYDMGNRIQFKLARYSESETKAEFSGLKSLPIEPVKNQDSSGITPIFIVGMNRSGTTLLEQMLASHSKIHAGGEMELIAEIAADLKWPRTGITQAEFAEKADQYRETVRTQTDLEYIVDKMPINFKWIGLIRQLFPDAPIISMERNAYDVCFSNFKATFLSKGHMYVYNMQALGNYYVLYHDLMQHWHTSIKGGLLRLSYEALVNDPESEMRNVITFVGLEWESDVLTYHSAKRAVRTLSQSQVRQKIYTTSLGAWRPFETHLKPMFDILRTAGINPD